MKFVVDSNRCQGYAQCCYAAPDTFNLKGADLLVYNPAPSKQLRDQIERAVNACPVKEIKRSVFPYPDPIHLIVVHLIIAMIFLCFFYNVVG